MVGARWAIRVAAALVATLVLNLGGWTYRHEDGLYVDASITIPSDPAAETGANPAPSPAAASVKTERRWWSGASSPAAANGTFGRWRGETISIGGTWDDDNDNQVAMHSICPGGAWARWSKPLDVAIGAIDIRQGETWAKAAKGAYDARWRRNLNRIKQCWGARDQGLLYIRFAHEMNIKDLRWKVVGGEEKHFVKAITRYSNLRYEILPKAKIVLCTSDGTSAKQNIDLHKLWPGKDAKGRQVADVYGVDSYNSWIVIRNLAEFNDKLLRDMNGMPLGLEKHRLMAVSWGVPFAVPEWGANGDPRDEGTGDDLPVYVQLMNEWFRNNAGDPDNPKPGQLLYEIYFNYENRFQLLPTQVQPKTAAAYRKLKWGE